LIATLEVGPRIIHLAANEGQNLLKNYDEQMGGRGEAEWQIRGGHRLWVAPEDPVSTYHPDNGPVKCEEIEGGVRLTPAVETANGLQKEMDVVVAAAEPRVRVVHRIANVSEETKELSAWGLTVMAPGGTAVVGLPPRGSHPEDLLPNQHIVLWPYTDLADTRLQFGTRAIMMTQRPYADPVKLGFSNPEGWAAYAVHECLLVKRFAFEAEAAYPDMGCNTELFTNAEMLEVESLGPMVTLETAEVVEHVEEWTLVPGVPSLESEDDVDRFVRPALERSA
jgi:hypothetical protein